MNISSHDHNISTSIVTSNKSPHQNNSGTGSATSYASTSRRSTGTIPKQPKINIWTEQLKDIVNNHNDGSRILILMRGAPGSGKSYLARTIVETLIGSDLTINTKFIYSTDDYFSQARKYVHDKNALTHARIWNQNRVLKAMKCGWSPIIIDDTNIELWEMAPYVCAGTDNGYIIETLEPNTPWAKRADLLQQRNSHGVPFTTIKRMLDNYRPIESGYHLRKALKLEYPPHLVPPVLRTNNIDLLKNNANPTVSNDLNTMKVSNESVSSQMINEKVDISISGVDHTTLESNKVEIEPNEKYIDYEKKLQEYEKCEQAWENGESWNDHRVEDNGQAATPNTSSLTDVTPSDTADNNIQSSSSNVSSRDSEGSEDEVSSGSCTDGNERNVNVNVGKEFITQLDQIFGRTDMVYPENISTNVRMPLSLINKINTLWMESLMNQLDVDNKKSAEMLQQDEDLARELSKKEEELAQAGKELNLKELINMELAMTIYQKITSEWRNLTPQDLAARMSREILFSFFPDMSRDVLSELLMAYNNDFEETVKVLLSSTNRGHMIDKKDGVKMFIMEKEMERKKMLAELEEKANQDLQNLPSSEKISMNTANKYRELATNHFEKRNLSRQIAQEYMRQDMPQVATYLSDIASFHTKKYEEANSLAAVTLVQVHAEKNKNSETLDLHFLYVPEAKVALDIFLDKHIYRLQESADRSPDKKKMLSIITGRGLHSPGGPRIKPAIKRRLSERKLLYCEGNPGLLTATVTAHHKFTYEI